jgi:ASC-1-like (ASCH) protein
MRHQLKTIEPYFTAIKSKEKTFEIRKDDRNPKFEVGDFLTLDKWENNHFTGDSEFRVVTYILRDAPEFGLMPGYCIIGIK